MMPDPSAFSGSLLSRHYLASLARAHDTAPDASMVRSFRTICRHAAALGRWAPARALADVFGTPAARLFGFDVRGSGPAGDGLFTMTLAAGTEAVAMMALAPAGEALEPIRPRAIAATAAAGLRWSIVSNGRLLALVDCARPHARRWLSTDTAACAADPGALQVLCSVMAAGVLARGESGRAPIDVMIAASEADLRGVRAALQTGVERAALTLTAALSRGSRRRTDPGRVQLMFGEALTIVYRILFLQFAEARGLVPVWHPTYRRAYTVEALRELLETRADTAGVWETLQAMARLAHRGARAGELVVVPFNGRLFSPAHAPMTSSRQIPDRDAAAAVAALTLVERGGARPERIPFVDLGVEQLGSIYERVLDFTPHHDPATGAAALRRGGPRKSSGSFYTPRALTEFVVRRTLEPLVADRSPEDILKLKVLDPAMGSGAFLVAACRFLARAYESSLARSGVAGAEDLSGRDRAGFRRQVAQHCLYGVDLNPTAVQLGRLSLWLCSLAADKPLTFLDHRLRSGNSLVGATLHDVSTRAPGGRGRIAAPTLFGPDALESIGRARDIRRALDATPDDTIEEVHRKEELFSALESGEGPLASWRAICDAWCAAWFMPGSAPGRADFGAIADAARGDTSFSHPAVSGMLARAREIARQQRFFHWELEFPEVIPAAGGGFDAVIGNPPWEMLRGEEGSQALLRYTRDSGTFRLQSRGHSNAYQLFVERSLGLLRGGGRFGLVLPWGIAADEGSAPLRRALLDRHALDEVIVLDNRDAIFPIHRSVKFVALSGTNAGRTPAVRLRPAIRDLADLDRLSAGAGSDPIEIGRELLDRLSAGTLAVPQVNGSAEVQALDLLTKRAPAASSPLGWGLRFSRELNATDDRDLFAASDGGLPVIAGRHVSRFRIDPGSTAHRIEEDVARRRLGDAVLRHRLAYRDVSGAGNRTTLIAAIVPPRVVTTHTVFCLKTRLPLDEQLFLCALLNSYVLNFVARTRVGTHVTTAIVHALPLPRPARSSPVFARIVRLARSLVASPADARLACQLHAEVAGLFDLGRDVLETILATFPLVPRDERDAVAAAWAARRAV